MKVPTSSIQHTTYKIKIKKCKKEKLHKTFANGQKKSFIFLPFPWSLFVCVCIINSQLIIHSTCSFLWNILIYGYDHFHFQGNFVAYLCCCVCCIEEEENQKKTLCPETACSSKNMRNVQIISINELEALN